MEQTKTFLIGATGFSASTVSPEILGTIANDAPNLIQVVVQLAIGIVTLFKLLKRPKKINP